MVWSLAGMEVPGQEVDKILCVIGVAEQLAIFIMDP